MTLMPALPPGVGVMGVCREEVLLEEQKMRSNPQLAMGVPGKAEFSSQSLTLSVANRASLRADTVPSCLLSISPSASFMASGSMGPHVWIWKLVCSPERGGEGPLGRIHLSQV